MSPKMSKKPGAIIFRSGSVRASLAVLLLVFVVVLSPCVPVVAQDLPPTPGKASAAAAEPVEGDSVDTSRIRVRWNSGLESFGRYTERQGPAMLARIESRLGVKANGPIAVLWVRGGDAFRRALAEHRSDASGRGFEPWVAGVALHPEGQIILRASSIRLGEYNAVDDLLGHELAHVVLGQIRHPDSTSQPVWLHEGLAQWSAESLVFESPYQLGLAKRTGALHSFAALESSFPADAGGAAIAYQQSESMVRFLVDRFGLDTLHDLLLAMSRGENFYVAFYRLTGVGFYDLEDEWIAYIGRLDLLPWLSRNFGSILFGLALLGGVGLWWKRGRKREILEQWDREEQILEEQMARTGPWSTSRVPGTPSLEEGHPDRSEWSTEPGSGDGEETR